MSGFINNIAASYASDASVEFLRQPTGSLPPDFDARRPPPSVNVGNIKSNQLAQKHKLSECSEAAPCKTRKPEDSGSTKEHCFTCLQRKIRIDALKRQLERLESEDAYQKLTYKKKLEEYQLGKEILLALMGADVFHVIEENLEGPQATLIERLASQAANQQPLINMDINNFKSVRRTHAQKPSDIVPNVMELLCNSNINTPRMNSAPVEPNKLGPPGACDINTIFNGQGRNVANTLYSGPRVTRPNGFTAEPGVPTNTAENGVVAARIFSKHTSDSSVYHPSHVGNPAATGYSANVAVPNGFTNGTASANQSTTATSGYTNITATNTGYITADPSGVVPNITSGSSYYSPSQGPVCASFHPAVPPPTSHPSFSQACPSNQMSGSLQPGYTPPGLLQPSHPSGHIQAPSRPQLRGNSQLLVPTGLPQPLRPLKAWPSWPYQ